MLTPILSSARGSSSRELGVGWVCRGGCGAVLLSAAVFGSVGGDVNFGVSGGGPGGRVVTVGIRAWACSFLAWFVCVLQGVAAIVVPRAWQAWSLGVVLLVVFGALGACVPLWLREPACDVAFTGAELLSMEPGLRYAVVLAGVSWRVFPERCLGGSGGGSPRTCLRCFCSSACCSVLSDGLCCLVVWVVHSGEGSSQDRPLSLLVEVLPRNALCSFWATVVLPLWFEVCRFIGLRSGEVLPGRILALLVEVLPKAARCCFGRHCSLSL
ncbi:hypothetical protein Taro_034256 [Colocasia esculenta]|uniref:Uncharacterized protein n=1 Tax=Colocasia esculenta TaxID=4460 RepID=A0A843WEX3_COLES|nr:hypothetical protein [Colocasia esculenta]